MLTALAIRDIVLIDRLDIAFREGLTVLTGETGAGKSILLDAVALALGGRGDSGLVRVGAAQGQVTAVFELPRTHPVHAIIAENGLDADDDQLILRRVQYADGRTRGFLNDQPVGAQVLKAIGRELVEIHGQHDDRALVDPAQHRALLDAFGGLEDAAGRVGAAFRARQGAAAARDAAAARLAKAAAEADYLRHAVEELATLAPEVGEEQALAERRAEMMQSEKVVGDLKEAYDLVAGPAAPASAIAGALRRLERRGAQAPSLIEPSVKALDELLASLDAAEATLKGALEAAAFDPRELERLEERLFALRAASRKYDRPADDLPALAARFEAELGAIDRGEEELAALAAAADVADERYRRLAGELSEARRAAAAELDRAVIAELPDLKLERARFITSVATDPEAVTADGFDRVEFWVETNPGSRPGPLLKVASGGELSRFMLALKVALADRGSAPTLIFDEIDSGAGGAVADAIGARLGRLGDRVQVVSVTHAPQVAARADHHFLIAKEAVAQDRVATRVAELAQDHRREEIARMLAGAKVTDAARAAAAQLLQRAG